ncbi:hypothetical protein LMG28138_01929 [Pararobbsia alpina]|uniref:Uncharacterized protein n=1 Tax=Pararobbsia alpina TaxID=621374 RepID=A0A6S7BDD2_9BURK|nr:hypothetical protein LMG28138_01929 [Pararobbsia alpina]
MPQLARTCAADTQGNNSCQSRSITAQIAGRKQSTQVNEHCFPATIPPPHSINAFGYTFTSSLAKVLSWRCACSMYSLGYWLGLACSKPLR